MGLNLTVVGASGAVGIEFLKVLEKTSLPIDTLRLLATTRSAGKKMKYRGQELTIEVTTPDTLRGADVVFVSATTEASRQLCPMVAQDGGVAIDDSFAFRLDPIVPLVVPEVNGEDLKGHRGIVSTPNCTTVPLVMALHPLRKAANPVRVVVDTYQAVSGAGGLAMAELTEESGQALNGKPTAPKIFPHQIAFNVIPAVDVFQESGYSKEEWKMSEESKKILHMPELAFSATCVRVPVHRGHCMAAHIEFDRPVDVQTARELLAMMPGMSLVDDPSQNRYPMPLNVANTNAVQVGRVRRDSSHPAGLALWLSADNLLKGAALNAVQIAEEMYRMGLIRAT